MRMEELSDSRYIKGTDTVERYLLNLVQEYFRNSNIASTTSKEYIIQKAVERMKEEITFDSIGVLSIALPNGETRTGAVTITLEDLNGEPLISPKLTAFNVDFGTEKGTACEGNDPRLSDARVPLAHTHKTSDIVGLDGIISTLNTKLNRIDKHTHKHDNQSLLDILVYTGSKTEIDLTILDTLENKIINIVKDIENDITQHKDTFDIELGVINAVANNARTDIAKLRQDVVSVNQSYYTQAKDYTDTAITNLENKFKAEIDNLIAKDALNEFIAIAANSYTLAGSMSFDLSNVLNMNDGESYYSQIIREATIPINLGILNELTNRGQSLEQCQIEILMEYIDPETNKKLYTALPYVTISNYVYDGGLQVATCYSDKTIYIVLNTSYGTVSDKVKNARIIYNVYSKHARPSMIS